MITNRKYPMCPPPGFSSILTIHNMEHHENRISVAKAGAAIEYGEKIFASFENDQHCLGAITLMLSDVPAEPLLSANQAQKASVLGLTTLGFIINNERFGPAARRVVESGDGVIIFHLSGTLEAVEYQVEVFEGRAAYAEHLTNFSEGGGGQTANSTLL